MSSKVLLTCLEAKICGISNIAVRPKSKYLNMKKMMTLMIKVGFASRSAFIEGHTTGKGVVNGTASVAFQRAISYATSIAGELELQGTICIVLSTTLWSQFQFGIIQK